MKKIKCEIYHDDKNFYKKQARKCLYLKMTTK